MQQTLTIDVVMEERWIPHFISFLKRLERDSNIGRSEIVGFLADGDGDFRAKFVFEEADSDDLIESFMRKPSKYHEVADVVYDAG